ncbi:hypothetical protein CMMCA002_10585 [Clavibacter michiganensis subsp. michiganensis]|nr:hypothetical protein CMMCA002_10585 [Clavibacter michiganensis subsp. michiganensis]
MRPFVMWSSVETLRAKSKGCDCSTELVKAKPRCSVLTASAEISTDGSLLGNWRPSRAFTS